MLAVALTLFERSLCPCGCGFPRDKAWDPESDGWFEARTKVCYAKAAAVRYSEEQPKPGSEGYEPGALVYLVDTRDESAAGGAVAENDADDDQGDAE